MHAIWTGVVHLGLLDIPMLMYSGLEESDTKLSLVHEVDLAPIRYARVCTQEEKEVPYEEVIKAYRTPSGEQVLLTKEDLKELKQERSEVIEVQQVTPLAEIHPLYYEKPYFLGPGKHGERAYALLHRVLDATGDAALVKFVLRDRMHLGAMYAADQGRLILMQLRFIDELRPLEGLNVPVEEVPSKEFKLALQMMDLLRQPFHPQREQDLYRKGLHALTMTANKDSRRLKKKQKPQESKTLENELEASLDALKQKHLSRSRHAA